MAAPTAAPTGPAALPASAPAASAPPTPAAPPAAAPMPVPTGCAPGALVIGSGLSGFSTILVSLLAMMSPLVEPPNKWQIVCPHRQIHDGFTAIGRALGCKDMTH